MDSVRVYFKVKDFGKWKRLFDEDVANGLLAEKAGVTKYDLQRIIDTGETSVYFELEDSNRFKDFFQSDINQNRIKEAEIIGPIRLEYMERIEEKRLGSGEKAA